MRSTSASLTPETRTAIESPVGTLRLSAADGALTEIWFAGDDPADPADPADAGDIAAEPVLRAAVDQLTAYFAGERTDFDLPLAPRGTPFQLRVWEALREIPYAETWSYVELARRIGSPTASRAVGAANGQNPLPIVVPCHRVVGSNGRLVGYGGGLPRKQLLLELEARVRLERDFA